MSFKEYGAYDALGLADLVRRREISARELLEEAVIRTDRVDPVINAVVVRHEDFARSQIDAGLPDGPFTGVPFLLKDLEVIAGTRTTYGSNFFKDYVADFTRTIAGRYMSAGMVVFGKTATPEFGQMITSECRLHGPTRNPWNLDHSAGGSSGGAAAAVAARIVPVAHATDGGGSIRVPASVCGLFGLKPSRGRTPMGPDRGEGWGGFACGHVVSISVRDSAALLDATHGLEATSPYQAPPPERLFLEEVGRDPGRLRIAFTDRTPSGEAIDSEIAAAVHEVARLLEGLGHHVEEAAPVLGADPGSVAPLIVGANTGATVRAAELMFGRPATEDDIETLTRANVRAAHAATALDYVVAQQNAFKIARSLAEFFESYDLFLSPTLCLPPVRIGEIDTMSNDLPRLRALLRRYAPGTSMFNMSGQPSMSVPLAWSADSLPLGMMFTARFGDEAALIRIAAQLEIARPWKGRRPPVCA